jgi:glucokinase
MIAAFDIGSSEIKYLGGNVQGEFLTEIFEEDAEPESLAEQIERKTKELEEKTGDQVESICVATTGRVNTEEKIIEHFDTADHEEIERIDLSVLEREVYIENDCNAAALGEYFFGEASKYKCSVHITIDEGIGAGIVYEGEVFKGEDGHAGEVGLIPINIDSEHHSYGIEGAWEAYTSLRGLRELVDRRDLEIEEPSYSKLKDLSEHSKEASNLLELMEKINAAGISSVINSFNPGYISVGGRMALESESLLNMIDDKIKENSFVKKPEIEFTQTKDRAHLYGALSLKRKEIAS